MTVTELPREELRNRLLRRVDWRFLLPTPQPERSICFSNSPLSEAVAFISESVADPHHYPLEECDLAVAINPNTTTLQAAYSALRPGGAVYLEWLYLRVGGLGGVRRCLEAAGFEAISCYWCWPWPGRASALFWLPLNASRAPGYYLRSRPKARSFFGRSSQRLLELGWQLGRWLGLLVPLCVVARKQQVESGLALAGLLESLPSIWDSARLGPAPTKLSWLLLTGGKRSINKVVGLVFADKETQPRLALKLPRVVEAEAALLREATVLQAVHARKSGGVPGVPQVIFCQRINNLLALGETVLTGEPLFIRLHPGNYRELALQAANWQTGLAGEGFAQPPANWWSRLVAPVLDDFSRHFGPALTAKDLEKTQQILSQLGPLPLVVEQRDFSPWNILLAHNEELVVLDWESAELEGLPGLDLIYFLTYLGFFLEGAMESGGFRQVYRSLLNPVTRVGKVFAESLEFYSRRLGLKLEVLRPLRLLCWLLHSRSDYRQLVAEQGQKPSKEALCSSLFFSLWEEELNYNGES